MTISITITNSELVQLSDMKTEAGKNRFVHIALGKDDKGREYIFVSKKVVSSAAINGDLVGHIKYVDGRHILIATDGAIEKWEDLPIEERFLILSHFGANNPTVDMIGTKIMAEEYFNKLNS